MKIYLVEDISNSPGKILACFCYRSDALLFVAALPYEVDIVERNLFYGQPNIQGYNN